MVDEETRRIWTPEQVEMLWRRQMPSDTMLYSGRASHPYTCMNRANQQQTADALK